MKTWKAWAAAAGLVALSGAAQAALVNRGGGMVYDTTRNITWLADMNHAVTSGYAAANAGGTGSNRVWADGRMGWGAAVAWADQLVYGGFSDWRLPTLNPADTTCVLTWYVGTGCTGGELSGLFVTDLGNQPDQSVRYQVGDTPAQIANLALFSNVRSGDYWSGTELAWSAGNAWYFSAVDGKQAFTGKYIEFFAMAVRPGDVAAAVPEPQTLALALLALGATAAARRRRSA